MAELIKDPNPKGSGWICGSRDTLDNHYKYVRDMLDSMVVVACKCNQWQVTLPLIEYQRCNRCGYSLKLVTDPDQERFM